MLGQGRFTWGLLLFLFTRAAFCATTPLEVFGRLPSVEDVAISPDGTRLAYITTNGDERFIYVKTVADGKLQRGLRAGNEKVCEITWADDKHLLIVTSSSAKPMELSGGKSEFLLMQVCDIAEGKCANPMKFNTQEPMLNTIGALPVLRKVDGEVWVYVVGYIAQNSHFLPMLFKFSPGSGGGLRLVAKGTQLSSRWLIGEDGETKASSAYSELEHRWSLSLRMDGKMKTVFTRDTDIDQPFMVGFSPDGSALWLEMLENDEILRKVVSFKGGGVTAVPSEFVHYEFLDRARYTGRVIGGRTGKVNDIEFIDSHLRETWRVIVNNFANERVDLVSATPGFEKLVIRIEGKRDGYLYALFDTDTYQFQGLHNIYEGLAQFSEVRSLAYRAADGFEVPGFIVLPPNRSEKNLPLVVLPHGGPQARDDGSFDWLAQALAAQGYAVLQPNFRGSDLGWAHTSAGFGEWGGKMQTDLSDGVRYLVSQGLVDAKRVCIVGGSYGGYAALAGATIDKDAYRCAVSIAGISDLPKFNGWISEKQGRADSSVGRYFNRYLGATSRNDPILNDRSPALQAANASMPILLKHGRDDSVVPFEQSELMANALKRAGKSHELVALKNEDHWLSRGATRLQTLQETVRFLRQYNPPD